MYESVRGCGKGREWLQCSAKMNLRHYKYRLLSDRATEPLIDEREGERERGKEREREREREGRGRVELQILIFVGKSITRGNFFNSKKKMKKKREKQMHIIIS